MNSPQRMARIHGAFESGLKKAGMSLQNIDTGVARIFLSPTPHIMVAHGINWGRSPEEPAYLLWQFPYVQSTAGKKMHDQLHRKLKAVPGALSFQTGQRGLGHFSRPELVSPLETAGHDQPRDVHTQIVTHNMPYEELTDKEKKWFNDIAYCTGLWWNHPSAKKLNASLHKRFLEAKPSH